MAPVTRRSQAGSVAKKVPTRKHSGRKEAAPRPGRSSPDDDAHEEQVLDDDYSHRDPMDGVDEPAQLSIERPQSTSLKIGFNPLGEMATKIGQEVEKFAIALDMYLQDLATREDRYQAAQDVVQDFQQIARDAVVELQKKHEKERARQLREEWSKQARLSTMSHDHTPKEDIFGKARSLLHADAGSVQDLRAWQQEVDLWDLFRIILETHYRPELDSQGLDAERKRLLEQLDRPHRYTPEAKLWQRFLLEDNVAKERALVKRWLEEAVDHQDSDISGIVEELESRAEAGRGLWSSGWMHTREKIKGEKRLRSWPSASDSIQPQIRRADNNELLVTQLDPDAPTKHQRALEKADVYFERAMWIACWEMLRRGKPWEEIKSWCEERHEGWRAVAMGKAGDADDILSAAAWRKMCCIASEAGGLNEFEAAVYGLLGGSLNSVLKVARTVDDHLHAHYSALLLRQFEDYRRNLLPTASLDHFSAVDSVQAPEQAQQAIVNLIIRLRQKADTKSEASQPIKIIQSYLMANELEAMINTVGVAIGEADREIGHNERLIVRSQSNINPHDVSSETEIALDPRAMRIVTHMAIVLASMRSEPLLEPDLSAEENILVSYIQQLRMAGKRDLIPLYASRLSERRKIVTMSDVLKDVTQPRERDELMRLMSQYYDFDIGRIFWEQTLDLTNQLVSGEQPQLNPLNLLEDTDDKEYPGRRIRIAALPDELTESDVVVVQSLQWFMLLPGFWKLSFDALSLTLRKCLVVGRFACALEIVRNLPYDSVSRQKSHQVLGASINLMDDVTVFPPDSRETAVWTTMQQQSRAYYELEQLVHAVTALAAWADEERPYVSKRPTPSPIPTALKRAKNDVVYAMQPLINGLLTESFNEQEAADFAHIRRAYLPEIIIAYNTVLYTAGTILTRDCLLESMDLSVAVAKEENGLADCLMAAGRMRELVTSFAHSSKAMLVLKAQSQKQWKPRKDREGKDPEIWEIGPQGQGSNSSPAAVTAK